MSTSTEWYAYIIVTLDHRNLASDVHKFRQSFFWGFTIFPIKRTVWVNLSRINRRNGLLNLIRGGRGKSPDLQVTSFTVAPAASVPFSWTFSMALWITCKEQCKQPPADNTARREQPATFFPFASWREPCLEQDWAAAASGKVITSCSCSHRSTTTRAILLHHLCRE